MHHSLRYMLLYLLLLGGLALLFLKLPTSFLPLEDRGVFMAQVQLPVGSTQQQTLKVVEKVENYFLTEEKTTYYPYSLPSALALAEMGKM